MEKIAFIALPILLTALLGSIINRSLKDRDAFVSACVSFKNAFKDELAILKNPTSEDSCPYDLLNGAFDKHRKAVHDFGLALSNRKRRLFYEAWYQYSTCDNGKKEGPEFLLKYAPGWVMRPVYECRKHAISNLEKLLSFARL